MNKKKLAQLIVESYRAIKEMEVTDPELQKKIQRFAELSDEMDKFKAEIDKRKKEFSGLESELKTLLESMKDLKDSTLEVENLIVSIKKKGYEYDKYKYKEAFDWLFERVNGAMKKLVDDALKANKGVTKVSSQIGVQYKKLDEGIVEKVKNFFKGVLQKMSSRISDTAQSIKSDVEEFKAKIA